MARRGCLVQTLAACAPALYWFHPLTWFAVLRLRVEQEQACDDRVLSAGESAAAYASHLLEVARLCRSLRFGGAVAAAMARPSQDYIRHNANLQRQFTRPTYYRRLTLIAGGQQQFTSIGISRSDSFRPMQEGSSRTSGRRAPFTCAG